jgi:hypothetical protein
MYILGDFFTNSSGHPDRTPLAWMEGPPVFRQGADPTKHDSPNFTHICKIFSQICDSYQFFPNICKPNLASFTSILQKNGSKWFQKTLLIKSNKKCKMCKLQIFVITNICRLVFVTFGWTGTWSQSTRATLKLEKGSPHRESNIELHSQHLMAPPRSRAKTTCKTQRPILNFAPRGKLCPPGVKLSPGGEIHCSPLHFSKL